MISRSALAVALLLSAAPALAQTPVKSLAQPPVPTTPPAPGKVPSSLPMTSASSYQTPVLAPQPQPQVAAIPPAPLPDSAYQQAVGQAEGNFPEMDRVGAGGQIQNAWNNSEPRNGVYATRVCEDCVYKVRTREFMSTTLVLPEDAEITQIDLGDATGFKVHVRAANMVAVRPAAYGLDTNLNIYTKSGAVYPFYLRSEGFNSVHVPDLIVRILGRESPEEIRPVALTLASAVPAKPGDPAGKAVHDLVHPKPEGGDFVRTIAFDPAKLRGWKDYRLWGDDDLKPEIVYRDDVFTYIRYGDKWDGMELSTAYVTIDGIDELVNSRVQGSTFIVESVNPLITLKNGKKFLCIQYNGNS
ncbi:TrbG/VirB9 family P-type conjugative transfer protein [Magnetospirillum molischianum]|uniref:ComB2 protein n=1 Tax=Magnetospirillum molischianum DSM 120 TaxID=1150626 RepID=H8FVV2_MAGML|nr:TrbG/VirB9 family P-type conjugative transfer protein [Magnetospirillum molischianum]CCG42490.1 ComB2 protein [Magnetospirillum molischianum DSM 120]